eukprot:CAMPEP_0174368276 /NCGR_PEP_ID=MMETSP0811_2-20130205/88496_1 /TAXON_ID=73025 ORGANISM="Eutreptiella gymnastica-like, Strain CCMP1594" /NCGR_SAMPLE_ID=MMETSP0811_2 /ASSEMBLY_ACC=CAM_ASM_000667 /LENGTH=54 /DNA_ID=CAMNT_0015511633 /DNA_START=281 /DNA_END=445 /DNA_ORIENTATION=+
MLVAAGLAWGERQLQWVTKKVLITQMICVAMQQGLLRTLRPTPFAAGGGRCIDM